jgi:hypothetical protein
MLPDFLGRAGRIRSSRSKAVATIARSYIAIKNQKQNAGLLCGNWRTIAMIGFTVNDRELFFAQN